jgi:hypothetical protein
VFGARDGEIAVGVKTTTGGSMYDNEELGSKSSEMCIEMDSGCWDVDGTVGLHLNF